MILGTDEVLGTDRKPLEERPIQFKGKNSDIVPVRVKPPRFRFTRDDVQPPIVGIKPQEPISVVYEVPVRNRIRIPEFLVTRRGNVDEKSRTPRMSALYAVSACKPA